MRHTFAIQVPINWDKMSRSQQLRYHRMQKRDSNIIKKYLGIIKKEHDNLVTVSKRDKYQIDTGLLDRLTLTTKSRRKVRYDLKNKFPRISTDELQECRESAVSTYKSYLELSKIQNAKLSIDKPVKIKDYFYELFYIMEEREDVSVSIKSPFQ